MCKDPIEGEAMTGGGGREAGVRGRGLLGAGGGLVADPRRLRAMVEDGLGRHTRRMRVEVSIVEAAAADGVASQTIQATDDALDRFAQDLHGAHGFDAAESRSVLDAIRTAGRATSGA